MTLRAFQYAAGDVNMDQQVSPDDINLILRARKYDAGPSNATWAQGDVDNDQDVDPDDINLILRGRRYDRGTYGEPAPAATASALGGGGATSLTVASAPAAPAAEATTGGGQPNDGRPTVTYDPGTGDIGVEVDGLSIDGVDLQSAASGTFIDPADPRNVPGAVPRRQRADGRPGEPRVLLAVQPAVRQPQPRADRVRRPERAVPAVGPDADVRGVRPRDRQRLRRAFDVRVVPEPAGLTLLASGRRRPAGAGAGGGASGVWRIRAGVRPAARLPTVRPPIA